MNIFFGEDNKTDNFLTSPFDCDASKSTLHQLACSDGNELAWAFVYIILSLSFWVSSSPFHRNLRHKRWNHPYHFIFAALLSWIFLNTLLNTPFFTDGSFDLFQPASLIIPLFGASLSVLLLLDLALYLSTRYFEERAKRSKWFSKWVYAKLRTKFKITFMRSLSESAASSLLISILCAVMHANDLASHWSEQNDGIKTIMLLPKNNDARMIRYAKRLGTSYDEDSIFTSSLFGVWVSCVSILVVHHVMERTSRVRALFYSNLEEDRDEEDEEGGEETQHDGLLDRPILIPMADWFGYGVAQTGIEMFIHLALFTSRFDIRHLLAVEKGEDKNEDPFFFDHTQDEAHEDGYFVWDFQADCGDGFHSSYAIAYVVIISLKYYECHCR